MSLGDIPKIPPKYKPRMQKLFSKIKAGETSLEEVGLKVLKTAGTITLDSNGLSMAGEYGRFEINNRFLDDLEESLATATKVLPVLLRKKEFLIKKGYELTKVKMGFTGVWRTNAKPDDLRNKKLPVVEIVGDPKERSRKQIFNMFNSFLQTPLDEWEEVPPAIKIHRMEQIGEWLGDDWKATGVLAEALVPMLDLSTKEVMDGLNNTMDPFCDHALNKCGV